MDRSPPAVRQLTTVRRARLPQWLRSPWSWFAGGLLGSVAAALHPTLAMAALAALAAAALVALVLAIRELDRDVSVLAGLGAAVAFFAFGHRPGPLAIPLLAGNVLLGALIGAALGDAIRDRRGIRLAGALAPELWRRRQRWRLEWAPSWLGWGSAVVSLAASAGLAMFAWRGHAQGWLPSTLGADLAVHLAEVETYPTLVEIVLSSLGRLWHVYALVALGLWSLAQSQAAMSPVRAEQALRRIAWTHALAVSFLALHVIGPAAAAAAPPREGPSDLAVLLDSLRDAQPPLVLMASTLVLLGGRVLLYLRQYGWLPALATAALLDAATVAVLANYCLRTAGPS